MGKHESGRLNARQVATTKEIGYHLDGLNLYLRVQAGGAKSWSFRYMLNGREHWMGLGAAHTVMLAEAREQARQCRLLLLKGVDPLEAKQAQRVADKQALTAAAEELKNRKTFDECAAAFIDYKRPGWDNPKSAAQWEASFRDYARPVIGNMHVADVEMSHVLAVLEPIWHTKNETAKRLQGRIDQVCDWATTRGYRSGLSPARWKGHLDKVLLPPSKVKKVVHHPALPANAMGQFMRDLRKQDGMGARALAFTILTAARSGEARGATWNEIDMDAAVWTVPAERMKAGKEHRVPLSDAALTLLRALPRSDSPYVFFASRGGQLSDMTLSAVMRRMEVPAVPHGFRSTFRDWCSEHTNYPRDVAEMALAHAIENKVEAAYRRGDLFAKRTALMADWAAWCSTVPETATVTPIRPGVAA